MSYQDFEQLSENRGFASGFRGLQTCEQVAAALGQSKSVLMEVIRVLESQYEVYRQAKPSGGCRVIEKPSPQLKAIQRRIKERLCLEPLPIFLGTPAKRKSNITNAMVHRNRKNVLCIDIKDHFRTCSEQAVFALFRYVMQCSEEAAHLLTFLTCFRGHLPTGAPTSPLLAYLAYEEMFHHLYDAAGDSFCRLSVFADDLTVSWQRIEEDPTELLQNLKAVLQQWGFRINDRKTRKYNQSKEAEVTGIILMSNGEMRMPNRKHQRWHELKELYKRAEGEEKNRLKLQMKGLEQYRAHIEKTDKRPIRRGNRQEA